MWASILRLVPRSRLVGSDLRAWHHTFRIGVENISNEVGSVKNVSSQFFVFLSTPVCLRSCGFGDCSLAFLLLSVSRSPDRLGPIRFIVSVLPTRHLFGPC